MTGPGDLLLYLVLSDPPLLLKCPTLVEVKRSIADREDGCNARWMLRYHLLGHYQKSVLLSVFVLQLHNRCLFCFLVKGRDKTTLLRF